MSDAESDQLAEDDQILPPTFDKFKLTGALAPPRSTSFTTLELSRQIQDGSLDLNPEYQRDVVWSAPKQVALVDSIFKNYYVPPVIMVSTTNDDGTVTKVCVDGKQRLTSIHGFLIGAIHFLDVDTGYKLYYTHDPDIVSKKKRLLPDKYKKVFAARQIQCIEYTNLRDEDVRDMFQRVQQGMALNTAERLQAIAGAMPEFVKSLAGQYFTHRKRRLGVWLQMKEARGVIFQSLAQFMYLLMKWPDKTNVPTRGELHNWLDNTDPPPGFEERCREVLKYFWQLTQEPTCIVQMERREIFAPVEFIFSCLLIAFQRKSLSKQEIARGIGLMRREVRNAFPGQIRTNKPCCTMLAEFITDLTTRKMDEREAAMNAVATESKVDEEELRKRRLRQIAMATVPTTQHTAEEVTRGVAKMEVDEDELFGIISPSKKRRLED